LCDRDGVYGAPRLLARARETGVRAIVGAELTMDDDTILPVLVQSRAGYQNLCQLLTRAHLRTEKGKARIQWNELPEFASGLVALTGDEQGPLSRSLTRSVAHATSMQEPPRFVIDRMVKTFGKENVFVEIQRHLVRGEERMNGALMDLADYQMHPRAGRARREAREGRGKALSGRTQEIQRLIGRALRSAVDLDSLGEKTIVIDCDVLEADGGTRTASVTGSFVAVAIALSRVAKSGQLAKPILRDQVAAISVGHVGDELLLDLDYREDSKARVDLNVVSTARGTLIEVQATAEGEAVERRDIDRMVDLGLSGVNKLVGGSPWCAVKFFKISHPDLRLFEQPLYDSFTH
jgi:ribonuclease PH